MNTILVRSNCKPLIGKIKANGSKNAILAIAAASILSISSITLYNVPDLTDVHLMSDLLKSIGAKVNFIYNRGYRANHTLEINCNNINNYLIPYRTASRLRASFLMMGPMLSRFGKVKTSFPGGCKIGQRPVSMHIEALKKMGAQIEIDSCGVIATVNGKLQGKEITFEKISVGATENIIMAAVFAEGMTVINNAAIEPEVLDLIKFLKKIGADINVYNAKIIDQPDTILDHRAKINNKSHCDSRMKNFTKNTITIKGVRKLNGCVHKIISDRIEAGTYALAAIITGGKLMLEGINISDIKCIVNELNSIGALIELYDKGLIFSRKNGSIKSSNVTTGSYPYFPSDMQPQLMSAMCVAEGVSIVEENIFENRFAHVDELRKLGAEIQIKKNKAIINGVKNLSGTNNLYANDLRSTAALVLASLVADGETTINNSYHLWRGYEAMHEKLNSCGADISVLS